MTGDTRDDEAKTEDMSSTEAGSGADGTEAGAAPPAEQDATKGPSSAADAAQKPQPRAAPAAAAVPASKQSASERAADDEALQDVGMFLEGHQRVALEDIDLPPELDEKSFAEQTRRGVLSWLVLILVLGAGAFGFWKVWATKELRLQVQLMNVGGLEQFKKAHIIEARERFRREDAHARNRYGEFRLSYTPGDAQVEVISIKYRESIDQFMKRYVQGEKDERVEVERRPLKKFGELTSKLGVRQKVSEQHIKNLPITQRTNPEEKASEARCDPPCKAGEWCKQYVPPEKDKPSPPPYCTMKSCTDDPEDFCTNVYKVVISKPYYKPRHFFIYSPYSPVTPSAGNKATCAQDADCAADFTCVAQKCAPWGGQKLIFRATGPAVHEVVWPEIALKPTPELFGRHYLHVMASKVKCGIAAQLVSNETFKSMIPVDEDSLQRFKEWSKLPEEERIGALDKETEDNRHSLLLMHFAKLPDADRWAAIKALPEPMMWEFLFRIPHLMTVKRAVIPNIGSPEWKSLLLELKANPTLMAKVAADLDACDCAAETKCWSAIEPPEPPPAPKKEGAAKKDGAEKKAAAPAPAPAKDAPKAP